MCQTGLIVPISQVSTTLYYIIMYMNEFINFTNACFFHIYIACVVVCLTFCIECFNRLILLCSKHAEFSADKALKWADRLAILIGVAKAVHFLHTGCMPGCFRNQLKTDNILLDEYHIPKLSNYGMSLIAEEIENFEVLLLAILFSYLTFSLLNMILHRVTLLLSVHSTGEGRESKIWVRLLLVVWFTLV